MKLGDQVKFKKCLVKSGESASFGYLKKEQEKQLEDECFIKIKKVTEKELKECKTGILVGKRRIGIECFLEEAQNYNGDFLDRFNCFETIFTYVYLVACDLKGFYRVKEEDLEVIL
jgi:hypothetical protein